MRKDAFSNLRIEILNFVKENTDLKTIQTFLIQKLSELEKKSGNNFSLVLFKLPKQYKTNKIDQISRHLLGYEPKFNCFLPYTVEGDGNCLYNSVSFFLYGNVSYHEELRVRAMIELILNIDNYANEANYFHRNLFTFIVNSTPNAGRIDDPKEIFFREALNGLQLSEWASSICIYALSNALNVEIQQIFPYIRPKQGSRRSMSAICSNLCVKPFTGNSKSS